VCANCRRPHTHAAVTAQQVTKAHTGCLAQVPMCDPPPANLCLCRDQLRLGCQCCVVQLVLLVLQGPELLLALLQAVLLRGTQLLQLLGLQDGQGGGRVCVDSCVCC
jgi:hypothetical protein